MDRLRDVAVVLEVLGLPQRLVRARVAEALDWVGLGGRGDDPASVLSGGGDRLRVAVARAIVGEPALILADEPTGNLDPQLAIDILGLFEEIDEGGTTVLFATHDRTLLEVVRGASSFSTRGKPSTCHRESRPTNTITGCRSRRRDWV